MTTGASVVVKARRLGLLGVTALTWATVGPGISPPASAAGLLARVMLVADGDPDATTTRILTDSAFVVRPDNGGISVFGDDMSIYFGPVEVGGRLYAGQTDAAGGAVWLYTNDSLCSDHYSIVQADYDGAGELTAFAASFDMTGCGAHRRGAVLVNSSVSVPRCFPRRTTSTSAFSRQDRPHHGR